MLEKIMGVRIETRWTDDDGESPGRVHVIVQGQDCGPSVPMTAGSWLLTEAKFELMLKEVTAKAYRLGEENVKLELRRVIGAK
jgi:hypothetical protein